MMFEPMVSVILSISNDVKDVMMNKIMRQFYYSDSFVYLFIRRHKTGRTIFGQLK